MMLKRNLLYTGMTRGKRLVVLVGSKRALGIAVRSDDTKQRWTWLHQHFSRRQPMHAAYRANSTQ